MAEALLWSGGANCPRDSAALAAELGSIRRCQFDWRSNLGEGSMKKSLLGGAVFLLLTGTSAVQAQFYAGKTVNMVINFEAGGTLDIEGRLLQRHLPKHISGNPTMVVQNAPGAGGLTAINAMGQNLGGKADGLTIGYFIFNAMAVVTKDPGLRVNIADFEAIGGNGAWNVAYGRKDMLPGAKRPADMAKAENVFAGGYARTTPHDVRLHLSLDLIGAKYRIVRGFQGTAGLNKAMLQNEVNFTSSTLPGYENSAVPSLIQPGIAVPLWQYPARASNGEYVGNADLTARGIPTFVDVYKEAHGKMPSGPKFDAFILLNDVSTKLGRVLLMPPGSPAPAVAEIRRAFAALANDQDFHAEYEKTVKAKAELAMPEDCALVLRQLASVDAAVVEAIKQAASAD